MAAEQWRQMRDFITTVFSPRVAVVASSDADEICRHNNLSFIDLLRPFGRIDSKVSARDISGNAYALEGFHIRFADFAHLDEPPSQVSAKMLADSVRDFPDPITTGLVDIDTPVRTRDDIPAYKRCSMEDLTPWFSEYRKTFFRLMGAVEHETFDHPIACLIAISTSNPDPMGTLLKLFNPSNPPACFEKGYMDPNVLRYYVLVHDVNSGSLEEAETLFQKIKKTYQHSHLLKINSQPKHDPEDLSNVTPPIDIWSQHILALPEYNSVPASQQSFQIRHSSSNASISSIMSTMSTLSVSSMSNISSSAASDDSGPTRTLSRIMTAGLDSGPSSTRPSSPTASTAPSQSGSQVYGLCLSHSDLENIRIFVREMVTNSIIPFMEHSIQYWNNEVAIPRRGITSRLFSAGKKYFGSAVATGKSFGLPTPSLPAALTGSSNAGASGVVSYAYTTAEAQMRKLGDFCFMLQDYKFAISIYDSVKKDFSNDKALKYFAAAQEILGLAYQLTDNYSAAEACFSSAISTYQKCKMNEYATRATFLDYELLARKNMFKEAGNILISMMGEDSDLRSALILEQAAHCFLRAPNAMVRKYAFHLILAGHRFSKCGQRKHAHRCYGHALQVYFDKNWSLIEDHIHFTLGRQSYHLSDLEAAVNFFIKLLKKSRQPAQQQSSYLREFLYIFKQFANKYSDTSSFQSISHQLPIPEIGRNHIRFATDEATLRLSAAEENAWESMAKSFLELVNQPVGGQLSFIQSNKRQASSTPLYTLHYFDGGSLTNPPMGYVGETLTYEIDIANPLQIPLELSNLYLSLQFVETSVQKSKDVLTDQEKFNIREKAPLTPAKDQDLNTSSPGAGGGASESVASSSSSAGEPASSSSLSSSQEQQKRPALKWDLLSDQSEDGAFSAASSGSDNSSTFVSTEHWSAEKIPQLVLGPSENRTVSFRIIPKSAGSLRIKRVNFVLCNLINGSSALTQTGDKKSALVAGKAKVPDPSPTLLVAPKMPLLEAAFRNVPESIISGEVIKVALEITNKGHCGLSNLLIKWSHPNFFYSGDASLLDRNIYAAFPNEGRKSQERATHDNHLKDVSISKIPLPQDSLRPGESIVVPVWIRGDRVGKYQFKCLFSYEADTPNELVRRRTRRLVLGLQIAPSIRINVFTRASGKNLNEFVLGIETENLQNSATFYLKQISSLSPSWQISPLSYALDPSAALDPNIYKIPPRQTTYMYFKLSKDPTFAASQPEDSTEMYTSQALIAYLAKDSRKQRDDRPPIPLLATTLSFEPLFNFAIRSRTTWRHTDLGQKFPSIPEQHAQSLFSLFTRNDLDLALVWEAPLGSNLNQQQLLPDLLNAGAVPSMRRGHQYIIGINLGSSQSPLHLSGAGAIASLSGSSRFLFAATELKKNSLIQNLLKTKSGKEDNPVRVFISCPDSFSLSCHSDASLSLQDIKISIRNTSWCLATRVVLELLNSKEPNMSKEGKIVDSKGSAVSRFGVENKVCEPYVWVGVTSFSVDCLLPETTVDFHAKVCFFQTGVFDVNQWRLSVQGINANADGSFTDKYVSDPVAQLSTTPHFVSVGPFEGTE